MILFFATCDLCTTLQNYLKAVNDFSNCVNGLNLKDKKDIASVENKVYRQMKEGDWSGDEVDFLLEYLKKQLKDEILYEEKHVVNK